MMSQNCQARSADPACWRSITPLPFDGNPPVRKPLWRDPFLLSAFLIAGIFMGFQLGVTVLQPSWSDPVTDWLRAALAWPELLVLVLTTLWLTRVRRSESLAWLVLSAGFLMYAIAQTLWGIYNEVVMPGRTPFPWWPDLFYLLQYPCFFLALTLLPRTLRGKRTTVSQMKVVLDSLLVMVAATALSWYFLLEPIYLQSSQSLPGKMTNLAYPVGDLGVLFGLVVLVSRRPVERSVLVLLIGAVTCMAIADSWYTAINLYTTKYVSGGPADLFWMACYMLFPLAGLVQFRLAQRERTVQREQKLPIPRSQDSRRGTIADSLRFLLPFVAALLAGGVIVVQATVNSSAPLHPLVPFAVAFGLLLLVIARQELTFLEGEHWRREREVARANELAALKDAKGQMDTFLGMASHELKTPLSSIKLGLQVHARRLRRLAERDRERLADLEPILEGLARTEGQEQRLERLVNDLLDVSRIDAGKLELRLEWTDLVEIARSAVEEQQQARPNRTIVLEISADRRMPVYADEGRLEQVVSNYLTNALKYSPEDRPVGVGVQEAEQQVGIWVRDEGPGLSVEEQAHIWERFHRARGIEVQSGTGVGLGLGLHICRTIIERHHGQVGVESTPGMGSTFWFTLPRSLCQ